MVPPDFTRPTVKPAAAHCRPRHGAARPQLVAALLICALIVGVLAWVILTWPRPGWREPPAVPTAPPPRQ